jgi:uncharacterized protein YjbI with pentapeptide repeats
MHEAGLWAAWNAAPMSLRVLDACEPKPFAEYLLAGHARSPHPTTSLDVDLQVGPLRKRIVVTGERTTHGIEAFEQMPLDHVQPNLGLRRDDDSVDTEALAATTPVPHQSEARARWLGDTRTSFGGDYLQRVYPGLPDTVDSRYFQAAPADQWLSTAEWPDTVPYRLAGVNGNDEALTGSTPAVRARAIVWLRMQPDTPAEIPLQRKTLWFLPDAGCGLIVFTGHLPLAHVLDEPVTELLAAVDWVDAARPAAHYTAERARRDGADATGFESMLDDELMPAGVGLDVIERIGDHPDSLSGQPGPRDPTVAASHYAGVREAIATAKLARADASIDLAPVAELSSSVATMTNIDWRRKLVDATTSVDLDIVSADLAGLRCNGHTFTRVRFTDCSLAAADLTGCTFDDCQFTRTGLSGAILDSATLRGTRLNEVDLTHARFESATLENITVEASVARSARFDGAALSNSLFNDVALEGASFHAATFRSVVMTQSRLTACDFRQGRMEQCTLEQCIGDDADFCQAVIERTSIMQGSWHGVQFIQSQLRSVTFGAPLPMRQSTFDQATLAKVGWTDIDLRGTRFVHCDFDEVCLLRATLVDATFELCDAPLVIMKDVDLTGASFVRTSLQQASLYGAVLHGARFDGCNLVGADLAMTRQNDDTRLHACEQTGMRIHPLFNAGAADTA